MTEPTDDELDAVIAEYRTRIYPQDMHPRFERAIMRAAIAKWGTPPAVVGEPVMWAYQYSDGSWHDASATEHSAGMKPLYPAPHPTQAQAGAVPLTCEWAHNEDDGFWDTECGQSWRFDDGGPKENHMNFCHCCGKPLRIKGGQHGTE